MLRQEGLTRHDRMKVVMMASEFWEWLTMTVKKSTERVRKWTMENLERRREQNRKASQKYRETWKENDPEGFAEYNRRTSRESMKKHYKEKREAMTEEELERRRAQVREAARRFREKKKAEKLAQQAKEKGTE